jgi:hypothetical protein
MQHSDRTVGDRVRCVLNSCGSAVKLEDKTGIRSSTWQNVRYDKQKVNEDHITALCEAIPEYRLWIETGHTAPANGQIAPGKCRTEKQQDNAA